MKDFVVNVSTKTSKVYLEETSIAVDGENIAGRVIFKFNDKEFIDGIARLEWQNGSDKYFQIMNKVGKTYVLPIKNVMTKEGKMYFQLVITQQAIGEDIPVFKSNQFYVFVEKSINAEGEAPSGYDTWLDYANAKLIEMDNLNIGVTKSGNTATITWTDKQGQSTETYIYDGENGQDGKDGVDGKDAKINGVNTINIEAGDNITIDQIGNTLTINGQAGGGSGNVDDVKVNGTSVVENKIANIDLTGKQDLLVSGTNIKTINNENILGSGNITISGGSTIQVDTLPTAGASEVGNIYQYIGNDTDNYKNGYFYKCVSETNIEHINTNVGSKVSTDIVPYNHKLEIKFKLKEYGNYHNVLFHSAGWTSAASLLNTEQIEFGINGTGYTEYTGNLIDNEEHTIIYNGTDGECSIDNTVVTYNTNYESSNGIEWFTENDVNSTYFNGEFYECKVYDKTTGELVYNLIPANNNGTPALYDTINQNYYYDTYNKMTYVAGGTTYNWIQWDTQPSNYTKSSGIDLPQNSEEAIKDKKTLEDLKEIFNEWKETGIVPNYWIKQYHLDSIQLFTYDEYSDYKMYSLHFYGLYNENTIHQCYVYIYTHYNNDTMYDETSENYYPRITYTWGSGLVYYSDLGNYLSKNNTSEYTPTEDYNPATKSYVDAVKNYAFLQYSEMPTPTKDGDIVQYKGTTNANYRNGSLYKSKGLGTQVPVLKINSGSKYRLDYDFLDTDMLEVKFKSYEAIPNDHGVIGNEQFSSIALEIHLYADSIYIGTGVEEKGLSGVYTPNQIYTIKLNENSDIKLNGTTVDTATFGSFGTLQLFDYSNNNGFRGEFYYLKIWDKTTGDLKKEWIPVLDPNDVPCVYETLSQTYIYNDYYEQTPNEYEEVYSSYIWELDTEYLRPTIITNSESTYTIANLKEHQLYNLGEITSLTITDIENIYVESNIFLESGSTPTDVSLPSSIENIGDAPTMTTASSVNTGTLTANKKYIISFLNGIAVWKEY